MGIGYMIMDSSGVIIYHNKIYLEMVNGNTENMIGHNMYEYVMRGDISRSCALMALEQKRRVAISTIIE
jgi:hypothetical protein